MKFLKWSTVIIILGSVLILTAAKLFPGEIYLMETYLLDFSDKSIPAPTDEILTEETNAKKLLESGAVLSDSLMLVNNDYPLPENYSPEITEYKGVVMNPFTAKGYIGLKEAIYNEFGTNLYIMSSFRTPEEQSAIIDSGNEYAADIYSSEHLTGLALDVYVKYHAGMGFIDSDEGQFVNNFCQNYGFIIRYPYYGEKATGIPYEPWHIRYVGFPHSEIITENRLTLEEYVLSLIPGKIYVYNEYFILRQNLNEDLCIPKGSYDIEISPDNTGFYIISGKYK